MTDDLTIPDFLNRKLNPVEADTERRKSAAKAQGIIWPTKAQFERAIRRAKKERAETSLKGCTFVQRKGQ